VKNCDETFAYILDIYGYAVVVYDYKNNKSWRVKHNYFSFDPTMGNLNLAGLNYVWHDGVFGMAMGNSENEQG
jgi:Major royal jelly protein